MTTAYHEIADLKLDDAIAEHLKFICDVELSEPCYSFESLRFYVRPADGAVLHAFDAGCSCPEPFADVKVSDLKETTLARVEDVVRQQHDEQRGGRPVSDVLAEVRRHLPAMHEAGAR